MMMHRTYVRLLYPPLIVAAVCAAWWSCYRGPFIYDDVPSIVENRALRSIRGSWRAAFPANQEDYTLAGRPVAAVTLAMSYAVSRDEIRGYRVVNVAIHIAAALVLYGILRRTLRLEPMRARFAPRADLLAAVVTLVWAVHPLNVPSVTYVVQRVESLAGLMTLLTLYSFIRARTGGSTGWYAAAILFCAVGMGVKETVAVAPLLVLLYDRTFIAVSFRDALRAAPAAYSALAATWIICIALLLTSPRGQLFAGSQAGPILAYLRIQCRMVPHYLRLSVWPVGTMLDYGGPVVGTPMVTRAAQYVPGAVFVMLLIAGSIVGLIRRHPVGFAGAWFFLILAPSSSIIPIATEIAAEHRMYLPLAAVCAVIILGGYALTGRFGLAALALFAMCAVLLGTMTYRRNALFGDAVALWSNDVKRQPANARTLTALGVALGGQERMDDAFARFQQAVQVYPRYAEAWHNIGNVMVRRRDFAEAERAYRTAIDLPPPSYMTHFNLGQLLLLSNQIELAGEQFARALELNPDLAAAHERMGHICRIRGDMEAAIFHYRQSLLTNPKDAPTWNSLGIALASSGRLKEAVEAFREALRARPGDVAAMANLARAERELQTPPATQP